MPSWLSPSSLARVLCLRSSLPRVSRQWLRPRQYSTLIEPSSRVEQVEIECRSSGHITLDIFHPETKPNASNSKPRSPIIYLPSGFDHVYKDPRSDAHSPSQIDGISSFSSPTTSSINSAKDDAIISALSSGSGLPVIRLNYRTLHYPLPIHDVLTGYDWVVDNLCESRTPIGVCGQLLGGSLAAMLAVTECQMGRTRISAAAVGNPIVDWPGLLYAASLSSSYTAAAQDNNSAESPTSSPDLRPDLSAESQASSAHHLRRPVRSRIASTSWHKYNQTSQPTASEVLNLRRFYFAHQDAYFDPFVSPALFFRTPGIDLLDPEHQAEIEADAEAEADSHLTNPTSPSSDTSSPDTRISSSSSSSSPSHPPNPDTNSHIQGYHGVISNLTKRRKSPRKYPPPGLSLQLPQLRISLGAQNVLRDQGIEFAQLVRRALVTQERMSRDIGAVHFREVEHENEYHHERGSHGYDDTTLETSDAQQLGEQVKEAREALLKSRAEEIVKVQELTGSGVWGYGWDSSDVGRHAGVNGSRRDGEGVGGEEDIRRVGTWFGQVLS
ncbi:hypothetical protein L228DRAFT_282635 [Xylona heveae TC161]|uniref:Alpha/beta hydrolase fold-3 domain-containing protein n=1 Tax=Xylona heveae (strain CBS 132557 / TC161) TaxID=1328760 RepID=A0A165GS51_XYLHT|nr:hypothetical protein L228DRAFT_282635 [Xylona heveae TC161]KZF22525.1 hypothetical protein L228DRAFT_282635 [Xylona heveae TC161]